MKRIRVGSRMVKKESNQRKCKHEEASAVAHFRDYDRNEAILILDCPGCGAKLCLIGSLLTIIDAA